MTLVWRVNFNIGATALFNFKCKIKCAAKYLNDTVQSVLQNPFLK